MILRHEDFTPKLAESARIMHGAVVIGNTEIGEDSSVWFNSVIRGDVNSIRIGKRTNIQDLCMVHCTYRKYATDIGDEVTVGHRAIIHGSTIENNVLIGMGAVILDGATIRKNTIVGAGSLVLERADFPPNVLIVGSPARVKRELTEAEILSIQASAVHYAAMARTYPDPPSE